MEEKRDMWDQGIRAYESICKHKQSGSKSKSDLLYYENTLEYFKRIRKAQDEGTPLIVHPLMTPLEIFRAMGLVSATSIFSCTNISTVVRNQKEALNISQGLGIPLEICSAHRVSLAHFGSGWFPSSTLFFDLGCGCDTSSNSLRIASEMVDKPVFYLDLPYKQSERSVEYVREQLEDLVKFLEEKTGRKLEQDKLREHLGYSRKIYELMKEIRQLRRAVPCPSDNTNGWQIFLTHWMWGATPEGVHWFESLRDELKERVEKGSGITEKLRVMDLFYGPGYAGFKALNWMQNYGVKIVAEPCWAYRGDWEVDFDRPLESLARKYFICPPLGTIHGPGENYTRAVMEDARDYHIDAAIWFVNNNCRQNPSIRQVKDVLNNMDIPAITIGMDIQDPTFITMEELRDRLEIFFESVLSHRAASA